MTVKRSGLGRNLSVLLSQGDKSLIPELVTEREKLPITNLQPGKYQPRKDIDDESLKELAGSIKNQGLLQPIVVRKINDSKYEIIAGERRWRACQLLAWAEIPAIIKQVDDETAMAMALVENLQREDLNPMDQARAMQRLTHEFGLTHQQVAELLAKSRAAVSNYLRLLNLMPDVRNLLENGDLDMGHARALLQLTDEKQTQVANLVVARNLSVRETEALVRRVSAGALLDANKPTVEEISPLYKEKIHQLAKKLQTQVKLKPGKNGKGSLVIHYQDQAILERMISALTMG